MHQKCFVLSPSQPFVEQGGLLDENLTRTNKTSNSLTASQVAAVKR